MISDSFLRALIRVSGLPSLHRLRKSLRDSRQVQRCVLNAILTAAEDSDFGKEYGFSEIRGNVSAFQKRVPIQSYETLTPYIERVKEGQPEALLPKREKIFMFGLTSGTTGSPKTIPITSRYIRRFRKTYGIWSALTIRDHPNLSRGGFFALFSDWKEHRTPLGTPCGAVTGLLAELQPPWIKKRMAVPVEFASIRNHEIRETVAIHHALARKITVFKAANPSSLLRIARRLETDIELFLQGLHDGTFLYLNELPEDYRRHPDFRPKPGRAREIHLRIEKAGGSVRPDVIWPEAGLVSCWTGGTLTPYLETLREIFRGIPLRDPGLIASEGRFTIPFEDNTPSGIPDLNGIFLEFRSAADDDAVPVGQAVPLLLSQDLEVGEEYHLVFTTGWGLYRYEIGDLVQVTDKIGDVPVIRFVRKSSGYASITGEKLSEDQVVRAFNRLPSRIRKKRGDSTLAPVWGEPPGYCLVLEEGDEFRDEDLVQTALDMDRHLQELNIEYASKRKSQRLAPLRVALVSRGSFDRLREREIERAGGRADQYKLRRIRGDFDFLESLGPHRILDYPREPVAAEEG